MAHATLWDTFPEVIRISWLLPSASKEKGTPREASNLTEYCLERNEPWPGKNADSRQMELEVDEMVGRYIAQASATERLQVLLHRIGYSVPSLTAECRRYHEWDHRCAYPGPDTL
jgi:hypothetical protein